MSAWMEKNMASFPDLRPNRRSAKAESLAASKSRARLFLAVSTALLCTASLAVSELATLHGAKAHDTSAFLTRELGPPLDSTLVRAPAHSSPALVKPALGGKLEIRKGGLKITSGTSSVSLRFGGTRGSWQAHLHGVQRQLPFGSEAIVLGTNSVEQSLTVARRQGTERGAGSRRRNLLTRVTPDGTVRFANAKSDAGLRIQPVVIFDKDRKAITPRGLRWSSSDRGTPLAAAAAERRRAPSAIRDRSDRTRRRLPRRGMCHQHFDQRDERHRDAPGICRDRHSHARTGHAAKQRRDHGARRLDDHGEPADVRHRARAADLLPHRDRGRHSRDDVPVVMDDELGRRRRDPRLLRHGCHEPDRRDSDRQCRERNDRDGHRADYDAGQRHDRRALRRAGPVRAAPHHDTGRQPIRHPGVRSLLRKFAGKQELSRPAPTERWQPRERQATRPRQSRRRRPGSRTWSP